MYMLYFNAPSKVKKVLRTEYKGRLAIPSQVKKVEEVN